MYIIFTFFFKCKGLKAKIIVALAAFIFNSNYYFYILFNFALCVLFSTNFAKLQLDIAHSLLYSMWTSFMHLKICIPNRKKQNFPTIKFPNSQVI